LLPDAFKGIKQIGVIGWGSQVTFFFLKNLNLILSEFLVEAHIAHKVDKNL
jgi:hypothetical protein